MRKLLFLALVWLAPFGAFAAPTQLQWGVDRTVSPWSMCVYDANNACQPVFGLPAMGGGISWQPLLSTANTWSATQSFSSGQLNLTNGAANNLSFVAAGTAPPSFTTVSVGEKVTLFPTITSSAVNYAIGVDNNTLWFSVSSINQRYAFYGGTTILALINNQGVNVSAGLSFSVGTNTGVTCSGAPTASFASVGGVVTHC